RVAVVALRQRGLERGVAAGVLEPVEMHRGRVGTGRGPGRFLAGGLAAAGGQRQRGRGDGEQAEGGAATWAAGAALVHCCSVSMRLVYQSHIEPSSRRAIGNCLGEYGYFAASFSSMSTPMPGVSPTCRRPLRST